MVDSTIRRAPEALIHTTIPGSLYEYSSGYFFASSGINSRNFASTNVFDGTLHIPPNLECVDIVLDKQLDGFGRDLELILCHLKLCHDFGKEKSGNKSLLVRAAPVGIEFLVRIDDELRRRIRRRANDEDHLRNVEVDLQVLVEKRLIA